MNIDQYSPMSMGTDPQCQDADEVWSDLDHSDTADVLRWNTNHNYMTDSSARSRSSLPLDSLAWMDVDDDDDELIVAPPLSSPSLTDLTRHEDSSELSSDPKYSDQRISKQRYDTASDLDVIIQVDLTHRSPDPQTCQENNTENSQRSGSILSSTLPSLLDRRMEVRRPLISVQTAFSTEVVAIEQLNLCQSQTLSDNLQLEMPIADEYCYPAWRVDDNPSSHDHDLEMSFDSDSDNTGVDLKFSDSESQEGNYALEDFEERGYPDGCIIPSAQLSVGSFIMKEHLDGHTSEYHTLEKERDGDSNIDDLVTTIGDELQWEEELFLPVELF